MLSAGVSPALPFILLLDNGVVEGRPVRHGDVPQLAQAILLGRKSARAQYWLRRGRTEHASVPAFQQLAAELHALGAPRELVGRALEAARDECGHALLCYGMAQRHSGMPVAVGASPGWHIRGGDRSTRLSRIARESLYDGIIGEGNAAKRARGRRDAERDELTGRVENAIVVEESRHADLAKDLVHWAVREGASLAA